MRNTRFHNGAYPYESKLFAAYDLNLMISLEQFSNRFMFGPFNSKTIKHFDESSNEERGIRERGRSDIQMKKIGRNHLLKAEIVCPLKFRRPMLIV